MRNSANYPSIYFVLKNLPNYFLSCEVWLGILNRHVVIMQFLSYAKTDTSWFYQQKNSLLCQACFFLKE